MTHVVRPLHLVAAFAALGAAIAIASYTNAPWWTVLLGVIGPDLSFLAAIGGPSNVKGNMTPRLVKPYNRVHHPLGPTALLAVGALLGSPTVVGVALAWGSHLLWDRGIGYGMRRADGTIIEPFKQTRCSDGSVCRPPLGRATRSIGGVGPLSPVDVGSHR